MREGGCRSEEQSCWRKSEELAESDLDGNEKHFDDCQETTVILREH